jgi:hypothetical protein
VSVVRLAEHDEVVALDHDAGLAVGAHAHGVDAELAGGGLGDVQGRLLLGDVAGRHQEVDVLPRRQAELGDEIHLGPAEDLAGGAIDHRVQQLAGAVVQQPDAVGLHHAVDGHGGGTQVYPPPVQLASC